MISEKLHEDLLKNLQKEKNFVQETLNQLEPLAVELRKPIATRIANNIYLLLIEWLSYILSILTLAFVYFKSTIYPFYVFERLKTAEGQLGLSATEVRAAYQCINVILIFIAVLFFLLGRQINKNRRKSKLLVQSGASVKKVVGELLNTKAQLKTLEQRHFGILDDPSSDDQFLPE